MKWSKITAILRTDRLEAVERQLQSIGVDGISVSHVKGFGEYANFYTRDWLVRYARIEIFAHGGQADEIADEIIRTAQTGSAGDGIVAILPVERVLRIRTGSEPHPTPGFTDDAPSGAAEEL